MVNILSHAKSPTFVICLQSRDAMDKALVDDAKCYFVVTCHDNIDGVLKSSQYVKHVLSIRHNLYLWFTWCYCNDFCICQTRII